MLVNKLTSCIAQLDKPPNNDYGGFTLGLEEIELDEQGQIIKEDDKPKKKKYEQFWIVGDRASAYPNHFYLTDEGKENAKVDYFHILLMGVIASANNLESLSTGKSKKSRTLTIDLATLSIANGWELRKKLKTCKYIVVRGIKYRLNFSSNAHSFYEGHGAAVLGKSRFPQLQTVVVADLGFGTFQLAEFDIQNKLPAKRSADSYYGGGGIASLREEVAKALANKDSSYYVSYSQAGAILESSLWDEKEGKAKAKDFNDFDVGSRIEVAINNWLRESPAKFALSDLITISRRTPIIFCGGGFAIEPVRGIIKKRIIESGGNKDNLLFPKDIGVIGITGVLGYLEPERLRTFLDNQIQTEDKEINNNANDQQAA